ncbi:MAG: prenyltransferase/squalene oxidase repeat-containing protein [Candidatus Paceibacterota bacterium]|jgi:hypothetical protein
MKNKIIKIVLLVTLFFVGKNVVLAANVNLTIRNEANIIYSGAVPLQTPGTIQIQGQDVDANSVLSVLMDADTLSDNFSITDLQYSSMGFYLKCIDSSCDNWQYTVNNSYPYDAIDKKILTGVESVYLYFGPHHKIILSSNSINTNDILTINAQDYDYQNNSWLALTSVNIGATQPNPSDPWSPTEIQVQPVDENGQAIFTPLGVGSYNIGIKEDYYFPTETLTVTTPPAPNPEPAVIPEPVVSRSSGGSRIFVAPIAPKPKLSFDLQKAFNFLASQQKENGSFGEDLYTDWTTMALASANYPEQISKLIKYFKEIKIENLSLTDHERHAMALMSLGQNPYDTSGLNYIKKIIESFDGTQFGDIHEDNDDIFALIVLQNAGYTITDKMIEDDILFVLKAQNADGSWDNSVDMTGAAIEALSTFSPSPGEGEKVMGSLVKAREFLKQKQKEDGGWGNASSTAWAIEGILALGEKIEDWKKNEDTPLDYLATIQDIDGGTKNDNINNKIWETSYVASVLSGKTWNQIMQKFEKPKITTVNQIAVKAPKKIIKNNKLENTATVINAIDSIPTTNQIEQKENTKKNWFIKLLDSIFSIF